MVMFVPNPITGPADTFQTASGISNVDGGAVFACSGTLTNYPLASQGGVSDISTLAFSSGTVTPAESGDLIVAGFAANCETGVPFSASIDSGFSTVVANCGPSSAAGAAYLVAPSTIPVSPAWSLAGDPIAD